MGGLFTTLGAGRLDGPTVAMNRRRHVVRRAAAAFRALSSIEGLVSWDLRLSMQKSRPTVNKRARERARRQDGAHNLRTCGGVKLQPDFKKADLGT